MKEAEGIQTDLWTEAKAAAVESPTPITATFIGTLNQTIDLQSSRIAARDNRVPGAVWLLLMVVAGCSAWASGYSSGPQGRCSAFGQVVFPLLIGVVITLIADIDDPRKGLINVSQKPIQDLYEAMK